MNFNEHYNLRGRHAFLSPSNYHWVNDTPEQLERRWFNAMAKQRGVELHEFASDAIRLNRKLPKNNDTLNSFVNDALGYSMDSEQVLYYSDNCFGTADAISFNRGTLRVHDLKTGVTPANMTQLALYAALFCLEYGKDPRQMAIELRIYQNNEKVIHIPEPDEIRELMNIIVEADSQVDVLRTR